MGMDENSLEIYAGNFSSLAAAEDYFKIVDGKPQRFMDELYLTGDLHGEIKILYFDKKTNDAAELFCNFPYGRNIVGMLKAMFKDKLKRKVNTAIVIYDFYAGDHFTGHTAKQMSERKTDDHHIFNVGSIYNYKAPQYLEEHPEFLE